YRPYETVSAHHGTSKADHRPMGVLLEPGGSSARPMKGRMTFKTSCVLTTFLVSSKRGGGAGRRGSPSGSRSGSKSSSGGVLFTSDSSSTGGGFLAGQEVVGPMYSRTD